MGRFIIKKISNTRPQKRACAVVKNVNETTVSEKKKQNNETVNEEVMTTSEKIALAQEVLDNAPKRLKKDKGLIERTENSKTILTEDNKELLKD